MRNRILTGAVAIASVAAISFGTVSTASAAPAYKPYPHQIHNMVAPKAKISQGYFTSASPEHPKIYYKGEAQSRHRCCPRLGGTLWPLRLPHLPAQPGRLLRLPHGPPRTWQISRTLHQDQER